MNPQQIQELYKRYNVPPPGMDTLMPTSTGKSMASQNLPTYKPAFGGMLPTAGGILGGLTGSIAGPLGTIGGAGAGTAAGYTIQDLLKPRPAEEVLPQAAMGTGKAMGTAALWESLPFIFHPFKTLQNLQMSRALKGGKTISGGQALEDVLEKATGPNVPVSEVGTIDKLFGRATERVPQGEIPLGEALSMKRAAGKGFTQAGKAGRAASAHFERLMGGALRKQIRQADKVVGSIDDILSGMYKVKQTVNRYLPWVLFRSLFGGGGGGR